MTIETAISNAVETSFNNSYTQFQSVVLVMLINVGEEFCLFSASRHQCK